MSYNKKMKKMKVYLLLLFTVSISLVSCESNELETPITTPQESSASARAVNFYEDLAYYHAPIHYQDVDNTGSHGLSGKADYITRVDFDGDLNAKNNWENIDQTQYKGDAYSYYSVVETSTHYFIIYAFFHPRDWTDNPFAYGLDEHENDLEGILTVVQKNQSTYGQSIAMISVFHNDFYSFKTSDSSLTDGSENIDGNVTQRLYNESNRFEVAAQAKGHGIKAYSALKPGGDDYVVYYPSKTISEYPSSVTDRHVDYKLINIFEAGGLWQSRFNILLFKDQKQFQKDNGSGTANAPWNWDDSNDGSQTGLYAGDIAKNPAQLVNAYFNGLGTFSTIYINNKYLGIE